MDVSTEDSMLAKIDENVMSHLLAISILYYDHTLTFGDEVNYVWNRRKRGSAYWFFVNRYVTFLGCKKFYVFRQLLLVFNQILVCVLLTLRIHALYEQSTRILVCLLGAAVILLGIVSWSLVGVGASWITLIVYDTIVFGLTVYRTWAKSYEPNTSIGILILRDGAMYYFVMALANLANILTYYHYSVLLSGTSALFVFSGGHG
ncbi:hypothetical protein BDQ17DRAFT_1332993 [Cyathus striatus]|nr:hypothetical protein BDQ17DRAFT_1332993 [Cyathus striatus]